MSGPWVASDMLVRCRDVALDAIQAAKLERRIRHELALALMCPCAASFGSRNCSLADISIWGLEPSTLVQNCAEISAKQLGLRGIDMLW